MKKVCVIGAGAAGLVTIQHVNSSPQLQGIVFEQDETIGGLWRYTDNTGDQVHSSMYKNLRINVPKEIMGFSWSLPFPNYSDHSSSFVGHKEVYEYLKNFANKFQLWNHIKFHTKVISVERIRSVTNIDETDGLGQLTSDLGAAPQWRVTVQNVKSLVVDTIDFDAVMVCNGNNSKPLQPEIIDLQKFQGVVMHSKDYRTPQLFQNKRVIIMGCGPSGIDIILEVTSVASEVILSIRNPPFPGQLPSKIQQKCAIKSALNNGFILANGEECFADILLLCTGYQYYYPFLTESCQVRVEHDGKEVRPIYRHLIHTKYPTLCFPCIPYRGISFYMTDIQIRYYIQYLEGTLKLPTEQEMENDYLRDKRKRQEMGLKNSESHALGVLQWDYYIQFAKDAGFTDDLKPVVQKVYQAYFERRTKFPALYKNDRIFVLDQHSYNYECAQPEP